MDTSPAAVIGDRPVRSRHIKGSWRTLPRSPIDRLMAFVVVKPGMLETECWVSGHNRNSKGYAMVKVNYRTTLAHRVSYEHFVGPIPDGLVIDHLCRNRACINPAHLEPVTQRENTMRGQSPSVVLHLANVCKNGHSLDDAYVYPRSGHRRCRICRRVDAARYRASRDRVAS